MLLVADEILDLGKQLGRILCYIDASNFLTYLIFLNNMCSSPRVSMTFLTTAYFFMPDGWMSIRLLLFLFY